MGRTTFNVGKPGFVLGGNYDANDGRQIDWDNVSDVNSAGKKEILGGTIMAETANGKLAPRKEGVQDATPEDYPATCILLATATEGVSTDALTGYGVVLGGVVYKNFLEDNEHADFEDWLTELKENGTGFEFETYSDSRTN